MTGRTSLLAFSIAGLACALLAGLYLSGSSVVQQPQAVAPRGGRVQAEQAKSVPELAGALEQNQPENHPASHPDSERSVARVEPSAETLWIEGRLALPEGVARSEARLVALRGAATQAFDRPLLGAQGRFRLAVPPGVRWVTLQLDSDWLYLSEACRFDSHELQEELALEARAGAFLRVRFRLPNATPEELASLVGQAVQLSRRRTAKLDAELSCTFRGVQSERDLRLSIDPELLAPLYHLLKLEPRERGELELELTRGVRISGTVRGERDRPLRRAKVKATVTGESRRRLTRTEADGGFSLYGVPPGEVTLLVWADGYSETTLELGELPEGSVSEALELVLEPGDSVAGKVLWSDGTPAAGARLRVLQKRDKPAREGAQWSFRSTGLTGRRAAEDGSFRLQGLRDETFFLGARSELEDGAQGFGHAGPLRPGRTDVVLLLEATTSLKGRVQNDLGQPVRQFRVIAHPAHEQGHGQARLRGMERELFRSPDGRFELQGLVPGEWKVAVTAKDFADFTALPVAVPQEGDLVLTLERCAGLSGAVADAEGRPVGAAKVKLVRLLSDSADDRARGPGQIRHVSDEGSFRFSCLRAGRYRLSAAAPGHARSVAEERDLLPGQELALELELREVARLTVALHPDLSGAKSWRISVQGEGGKIRTAQRKGSPSVFEDLDPGQYRIKAGVTLGPGRSFEYEREYWLQEGESAVVEIGERLQETVLLHGTVSSGELGVAGIVLELRPMATEETEESLTTTTDEWGGYELGAPGPGTYVLALRSEGELGDEHELELPNQPRQRYDIEFHRTSLTALVSDATGAPIEDCAVLFDTEHLDRDLSGATDGEGSCVRRHLRPGRYLVTAREDLRETTVELELEEGEQRSVHLELGEAGSVHFENLGGVDFTQTGSLSLAYGSASESEVSVVVHSSRGTLPYSRRLFAGELSLEHPRWELSGLPPGNYWISQYGGSNGRVSFHHEVTPGGWGEISCGASGPASAK